MVRTIRWLSLVVTAIAMFTVSSIVRAQSGAVHTQSATASIWGTVSDNHGAPLGGAKVTLLNEDTKESTGGSTDGTGQYHFEGLRPGKYTVSFDAHDFVPKQHEVKLKPGTKKVEVSERLKPPPEPAATKPS
jgi:carboxypeptidase family protein